MPRQLPKMGTGSSSGSGERPCVSFMASPRAGGTDIMRQSIPGGARAACSRRDRRVITGFNTDVKYKGVVYHVQIEDKGTANPLIETLIYKGGEILGSRRLPYADVVKGPDAHAPTTPLMEDRHTATNLAADE